MSPSPWRPDLFVDRSLGRHVVPDALRAAGFTVHTMADVFGESAGQALADETWLALAGDERWAVLFKDERIRYRPAERQALQDHEVRAFCLTNGNLRGVEQAARFVDNGERIVAAAAEPGPYVYGVHADSIKRLWPR